MEKRQFGLDLLRCLALLFVVSFHSFLNNGYYSEPQTGVAMWLAGSFRWLSVSCIGIFLMLTGYLRSGSQEPRVCWRGLPGVLLGYLIACAITVPIRHFVFGDTLSLSGWIRRLFGFSAVYYGWYVEMFLGLTLLSPFLNRALEGKHLYLLGSVLLFLTALPGATPWVLAPDHWRVCYPLTYYVLGAIIRRKQPRIPAWLGIGGAVLISLLLGGATVLSTDGVLSEALVWEFGDLWTVLTVLYLFLAFYRLEAGPRLSKAFGFLAGGCYGGYLLSHLLDAWCYRLFPAWHSPDRYPELFFLVTVPIFLVSVLAGRLLQSAVRLLLPRRKEAVR